jgi:hypothetical protein
LREIAWHHGGESLTMIEGHSHPFAFLPGSIAVSKSRIFIAVVCVVALIASLGHDPSEAQGTKQGKFKNSSR